MKALKLKVEWFDRIVKKYESLRTNAGFYSKNWVELSEVIDAAIENLKRGR